MCVCIRFRIFSDVSYFHLFHFSHCPFVIFLSLDWFLYPFKCLFLCLKKIPFVELYYKLYTGGLSCTKNFKSKDLLSTIVKKG